MADRRYYYLQNLATGEIGMRRQMTGKLAEVLNHALKRWGHYQWIAARTYERGQKAAK